MKKILIDVSYTKTLSMDDETYKRLQEENFSGQINILEEVGIDTVNIGYIDLAHRDNKNNECEHEEVNSNGKCFYCGINIDALGRVRETDRIYKESLIDDK